MKKKTLIRLMLAIVLFSGFVACKKSSGSGSGGDGTMSAKVDGTLRTCDLAVEAIINSGVLGLGGRWNGGGFTIGIPGFTDATGTFNIGPGNMATAIFSDGLDASATYSANMVTGSGKVTITAFTSENIKGSFEFTGKNTGGATKVITEGAFDINY